MYARTHVRDNRAGPAEAVTAIRLNEVSGVSPGSDSPSTAGWQKERESAEAGGDAPEMNTFAKPAGV